MGIHDYSVSEEFLAEVLLNFWNVEKGGNQIGALKLCKLGTGTESSYEDIAITIRFLDHAGETIDSNFTLVALNGEQIDILRRTVSHWAEDYHVAQRVMRIISLKLVQFLSPYFMISVDEIVKESERDSLLILINLLSRSETRKEE